MDCPRCGLAEMDYLPRMRSYGSSDWYRCEHCGYCATVEADDSTTFDKLDRSVKRFAATAGAAVGIATLAWAFTQEESEGR